MNSAATTFNIGIFKQFGFRETKNNGRHATGNCPFCNKADHFSINATLHNVPWDCKRCGKSGGYQTFVKQIVEHAQKHIKDHVDELANERGIAEDTFLNAARAGFISAANAFILPVYAEDDSIVNVKIYDHLGYRNATGMKNEMYGSWWMKEYMQADTIYVCEGEWDSLAMREALEKAGRWGNESGVLGVPGASTFKTTCIPHFLGKRAVLLYDNDDAGNSGRDKAASLLVGVAREIHAVNWEVSRAKGFDIRDLWIASKYKHETFFDTLSKIVKPIKASSITQSGAVAGRGVLPKLDGKLVPHEEVYAGYRKWLHMPNPMMLDVMFGTVFVNRIVGDPLWMFIVAVPGATKTEPLITLSGDPRIVTLSSLTPATMVSGMNMGGADPSMLPQLDGKTLVIKEFTGILTLPQQEREEIQGILRDAYDGEYRKQFGNGVTRWYRSLHFGILAAVTPVIEYYLQDAQNAALGERFLCWRNEVPRSLAARRKYIERAMGNVGKEKVMREELGLLARRVMSAKIDLDNPPEISQALRDRVVHLAQLVAMLRGTVQRDKYTRDVTHRAFTELGTRLSKQLLKVLLGVCMFRGVKRATDSEYAVVSEVARSSIPSRTQQILDGAFSSGKMDTNASDCSKAVELPNATCELVLGNLAQLGAVERDSTGGKITYILKPDVVKLMTEGGLVSWQH